MLDMGFEEDMERILGAMPPVQGTTVNANGKGAAALSAASVDGDGAVATVPERQTLLFSATLPKWVKSVAKRWVGR